MRYDDIEVGKEYYAHSSGNDSAKRVRVTRKTPKVTSGTRTNASAVYVTHLDPITGEDGWEERHGHSTSFIRRLWEEADSEPFIAVEKSKAERRDLLKELKTTVPGVYEGYLWSESRGGDKGREGLSIALSVEGARELVEILQRHASETLDEPGDPPAGGQCEWWTHDGEIRCRDDAAWAVWGTDNGVRPVLYCERHHGIAQRDLSGAYYKDARRISS